MRIAFAGNPNSGKTTMYNALTGRNERVGNWAGVTVEKKESPIKKAFYDGAEELLAALRANGQRVWLLSNAQRVFTAYELRSLGLEPCFDGVYLSSDWSVKKPDPRFFRLLLRRQDIRPETAVMIGNDGACDIAGARAAGLATVYVRSAISPREPLPDADYALDPIDLVRVRQILTQ